MEQLRHSLFDFPDDPREIDWKKEALLFYYHMLNIEEQHEKKIRKIFEDFRELFSKKGLIPPNKQAKIFNDLKKEIFELKGKDNKFQRAISFIVLITTAINKLEETLSKVSAYEVDYKKNAILDMNNKEYFLDRLDKIGRIKEKSFTKAENEIIRITRTESWRFVNEQRLDEFIKKGYKFKTTYPIKDDRTGEDSWYYYDIHQIKPITEPFSYVWEGKERVFMTPPDRPNDRNILIPYIE